MQFNAPNKFTDETAFNFIRRNELSLSDLEAMLTGFDASLSRSKIRAWHARRNVSPKNRAKILATLHKIIRLFERHELEKAAANGEAANSGTINEERQAGQDNKAD